MYIFYNSYGVRPFVSCMQTWTDNNCMDEDRPDVVMSFLSTVRDEYCLVILLLSHSYFVVSDYCLEVDISTTTTLPPLLYREINLEHSL